MCESECVCVCVLPLQAKDRASVRASSSEKERSRTILFPALGLAGEKRLARSLARRWSRGRETEFSDVFGYILLRFVKIVFKRIIDTIPVRPIPRYEYVRVFHADGKNILCTADNI